MGTRSKGITLDAHRKLGLFLYVFQALLQAPVNRYPKASEFTRSLLSLDRRIDALRSVLDDQSLAEIGESGWSAALYYPGDRASSSSLSAEAERMITFCLADPSGGATTTARDVHRRYVELSPREHGRLWVALHLVDVRLVGPLLSVYGRRSRVGREAERVHELCVRCAARFRRQAIRDHGERSDAARAYTPSEAVMVRVHTVWSDELTPDLRPFHATSKYRDRKARANETARSRGRQALAARARGRQAIAQQRRAFEERKLSTWAGHDDGLRERLTTIIQQTNALHAGWDEDEADLTLRLMMECSLHGAFVRDDLSQIPDGQCLSLIGKRSNERPPGCDHPELYQWRGRPLVFVYHPYGMNASEMGELSAFCRTHGLAYQVDARSWHYLGSTLRVLVYEPGHWQEYTLSRAEQRRNEARAETR